MFSASTHGVAARLRAATAFIIGSSAIVAISAALATSVQDVSTDGASGPTSYVVVDRPDWDGDGRRDVIRGLPEGNAKSLDGDGPEMPAGKVLIESQLSDSLGGIEGRILTYAIGGAIPGDEFGAVISSMGDVDLDGVTDLLISAPSTSSQDRGSEAARVYVIPGRRPDFRAARESLLNDTPLTMLAEDIASVVLTNPDPLPDERFGTRLGIIADVDGDMWPEYRVRAATVSPDGVATTRTWIFSSGTGQALLQMSGEFEPTLWKFLPGDANLDGRVDELDLTVVADLLADPSAGLIDPWRGDGNLSPPPMSGDVNADGVFDGADLATVTENLGRNQFAAAAEVLGGGTEALGGGGGCGSGNGCPVFSPCHIYNNNPVEYYCCCWDQVICGSCPFGNECCEGEDPFPHCNRGSCILALPCPYVRLNAPAIGLSAGYTGDCGDAWVIGYDDSKVQIFRGISFVPPGVAQALPIGSLSIRGVDVSAFCGDVLIQLAILENSAQICASSASATVYDFDIDVNSDNDASGPGIRRHEAIEMNLPGVILNVASGDGDLDGVPNWADGMSRWVGPQYVSGAAGMEPMLVHLEPVCATMQLTFYYDSSDPALLPDFPPANFSGVSPPPGKLRLWTTDVDGSRIWYAVNGDPAGSYIPAFTALPVAMLPRTVYLEAISPSASTGDIIIYPTLSFLDATCIDFDVVRATAIGGIDLDIDSDNTNGFAPPDRSAYEEQIEDVEGDPTMPGKVILSNTLDLDGDGITDLADGFDHLGLAFSSDDQSIDVDFTPIQIDLGVLHLSLSTTVEISYVASDPNLVSTSTEDPFLPSSGSLRLWTKPGADARSPSTIRDGGDFVPPDIYTSGELGFDQSSTTVTLYVETIRESLTPADLTIETGITVNGVSAGSDRVHITSTRIALYARGYQDIDFTQTEGFVATALIDSTISPPYAGMTFGAYQTYCLEVFDPRPNIFELILDGQPLPLLVANGSLITPEFVGISPTIPSNATLPPFLPVLIGGDLVVGEYNPRWLHYAEPNLDIPEDRQRFMGSLITDTIDEMEAEGWTSSNPADPGAFGKEVHARVNATIALNNDGRWLTNVYVAFDRPGDNFGTILSIDTLPPGGVAGTIEIDVLRLKSGYNPVVGDVLDSSQIDDLYEIKTSVGGKIGANQRAKLRQVRNGSIKIVTSRRRWTEAAGWSDNIRVTKIIKILGLVGLASSAYAIINSDDHDAEVDAIIAQIDFAESRPDLLDRKMELIEATGAIRNYLNHYDPSSTVDIISVVSIYRMLGKGDW